jgi:hypothetical protein
MIKCPSCGNDIAESAPICPHCGYSRFTAPPTTQQKQWNILLFLAGLAIPILFESWSFVAIIVGGVIIEFIIGSITTVMCLLTGNKAIRIILYFAVLDAGVGAGCMLRLIFGIIGLFK